MKGLILVKDKRTSYGYATRETRKETENEIIKWAKKFKNSCNHWVTIIDNGECYRINFKNGLKTARCEASPMQ